MIKVIWFANRNPRLDHYTFSQHWFEVHGSYSIGAPGLRHYIQHHTLASAAEAGIRVTHDGCSIVAFDSLDAFHAGEASPHWQRMTVDGYSGVYGGRALFDRPLSIAIATEHVVVEGETAPSMVKLVVLLRRHRDCPKPSFVPAWKERRGALAKALPGLKRYTQNHGIDIEQERISHDGWEELWFDDLAAARTAFESPEWQAMEAATQQAGNGQNLFDGALTYLIAARERVLVGGAR